MKVVELHISVNECIKYDGATNRIELTAVKLDDGRVLTLEEVEDGMPTEVRDFVVEAHKQVANVGWVYTSNPDVYGYPEETFELCGVQVSSSDVNEHTRYYGINEEPDPFVLDLTKPAKLLLYQFEENPLEPNAVCVFAYFSGTPTADELFKVQQEKCEGCGVKYDTPTLEQNVVSERAKLQRWCLWY